MNCNVSDLFEVLKIVDQYEKDGEIFDDNGALFIDGLKAAREATNYEKEVMKKCGFVMAKGGGIRQDVEFDEAPDTWDEAVKVVIRELNSDMDCRRSWHANISMAFQDLWTQEVGARKIGKNTVREFANKAADVFLNNLCDEHYSVATKY